MYICCFCASHFLLSCNLSFLLLLYCDEYDVDSLTAKQRSLAGWFHTMRSKWRCCDHHDQIIIVTHPKSTPLRASYDIMYMHRMPSSIIFHNTFDDVCVKFNIHMRGKGEYIYLYNRRIIKLREELGIWVDESRLDTPIHKKLYSIQYWLYVSFDIAYGSQYPF